MNLCYMKVWNWVDNFAVWSLIHIDLWNSKIYTNKWYVQVFICCMSRFAFDVFFCYVNDWEDTWQKSIYVYDAPTYISSSSSNSLFSQGIQVKLHISITHWIHTSINGKGSWKSNAYRAAYHRRTKKYTHKRTHDIWNMKNCLPCVRVSAIQSRNKFGTRCAKHLN